MYPVNSCYGAARCAIRCPVQGRDDVGRPLLQRALALQENLLGPQHPDVIAIRDVLASEDE